MRVLVAFLMVFTVLAGCAEAEEAPVDDVEDIKVEVDETTGAIRGVVVDETISPVAEATVTAQGGGVTLDAVTDADGIFVFNKIEPGPYVIKVDHPLFTDAQSSAVVEAGIENPPLVRIQIERLYDVDPFISQFKFKGYFQCAYNALVSSTCVNDYTRICGNVHPDCCPGGCAPELASAVDNREYVMAIDPNWQTINIEMVWEPSMAGTSSTMGLTTSYKERVGASHNWGSFSGESPMIARLDCSALCGDDFPSQFPAEGLEDFFVFMAAGSGNVAIGQNFEIIQTTSYIAPLPAEWSFVKGDAPPF